MAKEETLKVCNPVIKVVETYHLQDGTTKTWEREFSSKKMFIHSIKKSTKLVLPSIVIYQLTKQNKVEFEFEGLKRIIEIFDLDKH